MDLGIDLTAATLEEFRLAQGIETSYSQMSQAQKVMLRYQYLMANTTTQQGDFQRTNLSLANSMRTLQGYIQAVQTQLGVGLGSAIRHVVILLNQLMKYVLKAATAFATFMQTIFGKYKGGASGIAMEGLGDAADYADDLGSAADSAASGLGDAADNAKQLKKDLSVLPFDELNQLNKDREEASSGSGSGGSGGGTGGLLGDGLLDWGDLLENSEAGQLPEAISAWAQQIKTAFEHGQWNTLGQVIAQGLNRGIKKVYDLLDPDKVKRKVFPYVDAFATTFNSLVRWLNFDLLGRTIGRGINDVVAILDRAITRINWRQLGTKFAAGANGLVDEVNFYGVGQLLGHKFMVVWEIMNGLVHDFSWTNLGIQLGSGVNGLNDGIKWRTVADTLVTGLNGAFETLRTFTETTNWDEIATNITDGLNTAIMGFKWAKNAKALGKFINNLLDALIFIIDHTNWDAFGQGLGMALQRIPWGKFLRVVSKVIIDVFGGILQGMAHTPAGAFASAIIGGIVAFNIGGKLIPFINNIGAAITGEQSFSIIKKAVDSIMGGSFHSLGGLAFGVGAGFFAAYEGLKLWLEGIAQMEEHAANGNGILTEMGTTLDYVTTILSNNGQITSDQAQALFELKENAENAGLSSGEMAELYIQALSEMGVETSELDGVLNNAANTAIGAKDSFWELKSAVDQASSGVSVGVNALHSSIQNAASGINTDLASIKDTAYNVYQQNAKDLEEWQQEVSNFHDNVKQSLEGVGQSWGSIDTEQGNALEQLIGNLTQANADMTTAITNMEALNNSGLDKATVQAILAQVDPSSQAMTDLIDHMQADDATWQTFHDNLKTNMDMQADIQETIDQMTTDFAEKIKPACVTIGEDFKTEFGTIGGFIVEGLGDGIQENTEDAANQLRTLAQNLQQAYKNEDQIGSPSKVYYEFGKNDVEGLANGVRNNKSIVTNVLKELADRMKETLDKLPTEIESIGTKIAKGFATGINTGADIKGLISEIDSTLRTGLGAIDLYNTGNGVGVTLSNGLRTGVNTEGLVSEVDSALRTGFGGIDLYQTGMGIGVSLGNGIVSGLSSIYIPTPHMWVSLLEYVDLGGAGMYIPHFSVGWYRSGGLFMGGDGQMIGIAENGRDEAVLPLEDQRAMKRIGSAIAEAGGGGTGMNDQLVDKIADRLADIILMSKDEPDPIFNIEVRTENDEVLARAVTRGQQKLDYRNNPTPSYGY